MSDYLVWGIVGIVVFVAVLGFIENASLTGYDVKFVDKATNTILFARIEMNKNIAEKIPSISGDQLKGFAQRVITTNKGNSRYSQSLKFNSLQDNLKGGNITFDQDEEGYVSDFLVFNDLIFDYRISFSPGLQSSADSNGTLTDLIDRKIVLMNKPYVFSKAKLTNDQVEFVLFSDSSKLVLRDSNITDNSFDTGVIINGNYMRNANVKIIGTKMQNYLVVSEIIYRLLHVGRVDESIVRIPPRSSLGQNIKYPASLLSENFDIFYGGMGGIGSPIKQSPIAQPSPGGSLIDFRPAGKGYSLSFTNIRGMVYNIIPFMENRNGLVFYGDSRHNLVFDETAGFFINKDDLFITIDSNDVRGETNIISYRGIDKNSNSLLFQDMSGSFASGNYNPGTGNGTLTAGGHNYPLEVDLSMPGNPIRVDLNGDGAINNGRSKIIVLGGGMIELSTNGLSTISMIVRTKAKLFEERTTDEVLIITFSADSGRIKADVLQQADLPMKTDRNFIDRGMSSYGITFELNKIFTPPTLKIIYPSRKGGATVKSFATGTESYYKPQAAGFIIVTAEKDRLLQFLSSNEKLIT